MQYIIVFAILAIAIARLVATAITRSNNKHGAEHCSGCPLAEECNKKKNNCTKGK